MLKGSEAGKAINESINESIKQYQLGHGKDRQIAADIAKRTAYDNLVTGIAKKLEQTDFFSFFGHFFSSDNMINTDTFAATTFQHRKWHDKDRRDREVAPFGIISLVLLYRFSASSSC